jgi:hypothetical protein
VCRNNEICLRTRLVIASDYEIIDTSLRHDNKGIENHEREIRTTPAYNDILDITFSVNFFRRVCAVHSKFGVLHKSDDLPAVTCGWETSILCQPKSQEILHMYQSVVDIVNETKEMLFGSSHEDLLTGFQVQHLSVVTARRN